MGVFLSCAELFACVGASNTGPREQQDGEGHTANLEYMPAKPPNVGE